MRRSHVGRKVLHRGRLSHVAAHACVNGAHLHLTHATTQTQQADNDAFVGRNRASECFSCAHLYIVDSQRQQVPEQEGAGAAVHAASQEAVQVDVVDGDGSVGSQGGQPEDTHGAAVNKNHLWGRHPVWLWGHTHRGVKVFPSSETKVIFLVPSPTKIRRNIVFSHTFAEGI